MDIFDSNLQGVDISVFEEEAPEKAVLAEEKSAMKMQSGKLKTVLTAVAALACFSLAVFGASRFINPEIRTFGLGFDGKDEVAAIEKHEADLPGEYGQELDLAEEAQAAIEDSAYAASEDSAAQLENMLDPAASASGIYVDGEFCVALSTAEEANLILSNLIEKYAKDRPEVVSVGFAEKVEVKPVSVVDEDIMPADEAYEYLQSLERAAVEHVVTENHQTLYDVAQAYDVDAYKLLLLNGGLNPDRLNVGDTVIISGPGKALNVVVTREVCELQPVAYETKKIDNPNAYRGMETVLQEGNEGLNQVSYTIIEENGKIISDKVSDISVLVEANDYIVERGTKTVVASRYFNRTLGKTVKAIDVEFIWPLTGIITDSFGKKRSTGTHTGLDVAVNTGTEVKAMADGVVVLSERENSYGNLIKIDHGNGVETWYAHLSKRNVSLGDVVKQGDVIALSGNTGRSTGPHLHIEVRIDKVAYNALWYLP